MAHLRIENDGMVGNQTRVIHVADDATETDISSVCRDVKLHMNVRDANTATLEMIKVQGCASAELVEATVENLRPARLTWLRRLREVTTFNRDGQRSYVRS